MTADSTPRPLRRAQPLRPTSPPASPAAEDVTDDAAPAAPVRRLWLHAVPSWAVSMAVHAVALIALALIPLPQPAESGPAELVVMPVDPEAEVLPEFALEDLPQLETDEIFSEAPAETTLLTAAPPEATEVALSADLAAGDFEIELGSFADEVAPYGDLTVIPGAAAGGGFDGRIGPLREKLLGEAEGDAVGQTAVVAALRWLARHQAPDGGWSFDHRAGGSLDGKTPPCGGRCGEAGSATQARRAATALALLPFLGRGETHRGGAHQRTVAAGLAFLLRSGQLGPDGLSFHEPEGTMYSHGLATIVLTEAYALTHDKELLAPAQAALDFLVRAQDPVGGGWGYAPRSSGDTSVLGWQLMALKSGHMAYLRVDPAAIRGAARFLDSVSEDSGAAYGYRTPGRGPATTACGLLARMHLGWKRDHPALERGVAWLAERGVSRENLYYDYYAAQVLRQYDGEPWDRWNAQMKAWLPPAQEQEGCLSGSWLRRGDHGSERGGRLYCTAMCCMMLEVYYRVMPLYTQQAAEEDFPL